MDYEYGISPSKLAFEICLIDKVLRLIDKSLV